MLMPDVNDYDPVLRAYMATGEPARDLLPAPGQTIAMDIETPGLHDVFTIKCVTAAWDGPDGVTQAVLLDPARNPRDWQQVSRIADLAGELVFHNSGFDIPGLAAAELIDEQSVMKVVDTLVYARMAFPDVLVRKRLDDLARRYLNMHDNTKGMSTAFAAAGYRKESDGYLHMDIDVPVYRTGAMSDTIVTLRILQHLRAECLNMLLDHPFSSRGCTTQAEAVAVREKQQMMNRIMLRRNGVHGLEVNLDYLEQYRDHVGDEMTASESRLERVGIRPGVGLDLVTYLEKQGELPGAWPRTATGKLSSTKEHVEMLTGHPLAQAHHHVAHSRKMLGYLEKTDRRSSFTGRLHPQCGILGASATGRSSYSDPELHQFSAEARPIIRFPHGGTSLDWSQIEPVTLAVCAADLDFLAPFEAGADLYEPLMRAAEISRKPAKTVLLGLMYGLGVTKLAIKLDKSRDEASLIKRRVLGAMPKSARFMALLNQIATEHKCVITIGGRILPVPVINGQVAAYKGVNYFVQGSAYDILAETVLECEARGIGKHIQLTMHDELLVDTEVAAEVEQIMQTPPPPLLRWATQKPVLRTDRADLGQLWHDPESPPVMA